MVRAWSCSWKLPGGSDGKAEKRLPTVRETQVSGRLQVRGRLQVSWRLRFGPWVGKIPLEKEIATHSSTLAWKIPWTEDPGRLQSMGSQRVGHD